MMYETKEGNIEIEPADLVIIAVPLNPAKEVAVIKNGQVSICSRHPGFSPLLAALTDACDERLRRINAEAVSRQVQPKTNGGTTAQANS